jgi:hypothetical protein
MHPSLMNDDPTLDHNEYPNVQRWGGIGGNGDG